MKCKNCGAGISQEMRNCPYCGSGIDLPFGNVNPEKVTPKIEIHIESHSGNEPQAMEESQICPKCKAMIPLSKVIVAKKPPTAGQWVLTVILGISFIASCQVEVKESAEVAAKIVVMAFFGAPLAWLLWSMFTGKFWICPACHKAIKVKRNPGTKFQANSKSQNMR